MSEPLDPALSAVTGATRIIKHSFPSGRSHVHEQNSDDTCYRMPLCIPPDHPCLPGHFPGHPLVPGVLLLERIADALRIWRGLRMAGIPEVKFLAPLYPDQQAELALHEKGGDRFRFEVQRAGQVLARGSIAGVA